MNDIVRTSLIESDNAGRIAQLNTDYANLAELLERRDVDIDAITEKAGAFSVAVPSWGTGTGGTRFARFPGVAEPRNIFEKLEDCAVINTLVQCTPAVSPHFPWDCVDDFSELRQFADSHGLEFRSYVGFFGL